jgi:hypothetical protein
MNKIIIVLFLFLSVLKVNGQNASIDSKKNKKNIQFKYKSLIIPTVLIGYGVVGLISPTLKDINISTKNEFREHDDKKVKIDDFSQYSPFLSVYALNATGIQGKNNFKDITIVWATAYLIMGASVNIIKKLQKLKDQIFHFLSLQHKEETQINS